MTGHVGSERLAFGIAVLGGPTTVIDIVGLRIVPTRPSTLLATRVT